MIFTSVDLPAPFSPTSAWIDPASTRMLPERSARTGPKAFATSRSSSLASATALVICYVRSIERFQLARP